MSEKPAVRVDRATDDERYVATDSLVWFDEEVDLPVADQLVGVPPAQRFAAHVDGASPASYPGIYGVRPLQLALPAEDGANLVPCAGLTWVGVHPDHRRQGVLSAMMRHHVEQTRREGVAISALHASEPAIYGRYGYGLASTALSLSLGRGTTFTAPHLEDAAGEVRTTLATETGDALAHRLRECDLRVASRTPGMVVGEPGFYAGILRELPEELRDKERRRFLVATRGGVDVGHAAFRRSHKWERNRPAGTLEVHALVGEPAAELALLRRLVDFDLMGTVKLPEIGLDDPLLHWMGPRADTEAVPVDNLWLRVVDLGAAVPQRSYTAACDVVVEVLDDQAPWQAGRWRIEVAGGEGRATRADGAAEITLPVAALGAILLGGTPLAGLHRAGVVLEHRSGAVTELGRAFRADVAPAAAFGF
ncbi:GNAT family N-acetyltransferase [Nocardioides coralli]|uniref:GNAT family N-acetyltransferase n=1 Tax=Nocardioides coralli TaxID=2872154 RepID=UPI001CA3BC8D|nr:GNAT family N-acetyltransferase [Nocardioides coralli]QZY28292.1 GNAT family N-acetyltransferase [Nocardioides coralli]